MLFGESLARKVKEREAVQRLQRGRCAICGVEEQKLMRILYYDHDHLTGQGRGLLCHACNVGLGWFRENPQAMRAAADYIEKHSAMLRAARPDLPWTEPARKSAPVSDAKIAEIGEKMMRSVAEAIGPGHARAVAAAAVQALAEEAKKSAPGAQE